MCSRAWGLNMENEAVAKDAYEEGILSKSEEERLIYVADLLKSKGIGKDCAIWTCVSSADAGKLEEYIHFVENNYITDDLLYAWELKNIQRPTNIYEYEDGAEYEFVSFEDD